jgi:acyl carrier protein
MLRRMVAPPTSQHLRSELKRMIVEVLTLEDVEAADIDDAALLFGSSSQDLGLGLDSVDALELSMEVERRYGVRISSDEGGRAALRSIATLAEYIAARSGSPR